MTDSQNKSFIGLSWCSRIISCLSILLCSLVLQTIGCILPGWIFLRFMSGDTAHIGLWWVMKCGEICHSESTDDYGVFLTYGEDTLILYRVSAVLGIISCFIAIIISRCGRKSEKTTQKRTCVVKGFTALASILSGSSTIFAVANIGWNNIKLVEAFGDRSPVSFPYALFASGISGMLAFSTGLFILRKFCNLFQKESIQYEPLKSQLLSSGGNTDHPKDVVVTMIPTKCNDKMKLSVSHI